MNNNSIFFKKPPSAFSPDFTPENSLKIVTDQERYAYEAFKKRIQEVVLNNLGNTKTEWLIKDIPGLSPATFAILKDKITKRGFDWKHDAGGSYQSGMAEWDTAPPKLTLSLPEKPYKEEDNGYFSDGWNPSFRAIRVKQEIQKRLENQYNKIASIVKSVMDGSPGYSGYRFDIEHNYSRTALDWVIGDLNGNGYVAKLEYGSIQTDMSGASESYYYLICTNPKGFYGTVTSKL